MSKLFFLLFGDSDNKMFDNNGQEDGEQNIRSKKAYKNDTKPD